MNLEYEVTNQRCKRKDKNLVVNDSQNYLEISFSFSDDWAGCDKFVFFRCGGINYPYGVTGDKIIVPAIFLKDEWLTFGVYGVNDSEDVVITTNLCKVRLGKSFYDSETGQIDDTIYTRSIVEEIFIAINSKSDLGHTHVKSEITDFAHDHDDRYYTETEIDTALNGKANATHSHNISDVVNLQSSLNVKSDIGHTHNKSDITDFAHNHDERYYTETEVNEIIEQTKHDLLNRVGLVCDKEIIETEEDATITISVFENGMALKNTNVDLYMITEGENIDETNQE